MFCGENQSANHVLPNEFKPFLTYMNDIQKKNTTRRFEYSCYNGLVLTMGGDTQKRFRHGVPKVIRSSPRISLSFRQFKCNK